MVTYFAFRNLYDFETFFSYIGANLFRFIMIWVLEWTSEVGAMTSVSSREYNVQLPRAIIMATYYCATLTAVEIFQRDTGPPYG
jgi:hypothetical protein